MQGAAYYGRPSLTAAKCMPLNVERVPELMARATRGGPSPPHRRRVRPYSAGRFLLGEGRSPRRQHEGGNGHEQGRRDLWPEGFRIAPGMLTPDNLSWGAQLRGEAGYEVKKVSSGGREDGHGMARSQLASFWPAIR